MEIFREAGLPDGVINLVHGDGKLVTDVAMAHRDFAGLHFTGSADVFKLLWKKAATNLDRYRSYPRIVGEAGGKDFVIAHPSADTTAFAVGLLRGAFEYQGQKCSAASRAYIPRSIWPSVRDQLTAMMRDVQMGDTRDFSNFMGAVIDQRAHDRISGYLDDAKANASVVQGGTADASTGWFVEPTLVETSDPQYRLMQEEIFGPLLTAYVYDDAKWTETLELVNTTSPYALTGAVFSQDRGAVRQAHQALRHAAGNFYVNDKCTGAVVGQQPFGGGRASGTNDKAGSKLNLVRWVNARTVKETFAPPHDWRYPFLGAE
jgi:1-pyrroline-5-carboxylate dehydrogenase